MAQDVQGILTIHTVDHLQLQPGRKGGDRILGVAASCGLCRCWPCTVCTSDVHTVRGAVLQFCQVM